MTQPETEMRRVCPQPSTRQDGHGDGRVAPQHIYGVGTSTGVPAAWEHASIRPCNSSGRARPSEGLGIGTIKKQPSIRDPSPRAKHRWEHRNPSVDHHNAAPQTFVVQMLSALMCSRHTAGNRYLGFTLSSHSLSFYPSQGMGKQSRKCNSETEDTVSQDPNRL